MSSEEVPAQPSRFDFDSFARLYDDATIDAIENHSGEPREVVPRPQLSDDTRRTDTSPPGRARGSKNVAAVGMIAAGLLRGVDSALDTEDKEPIVDFIDEDRDARQQKVSVFLVPGNPKASIAIVRPWLFK